MDGLLTVLVLSSVIGLILVPFMAMRGARKWRKILSQEWQIYQTLANNFRHLKEEIEQMADEWPMFARPVLYTHQDRDAQIEFAHAQEHIYEASILLPEISKYRLIDNQADKSGLFALADNISTIWNGLQFSENVGILDRVIDRILDTKEKINRDREVNLQLQRATDQKLQLLEERIKEIEQIIDSIGQVNDDILWALTLARQSMDAASKNIETHTEDGLEYAVADILFRIGKDILDYLELYVKGLQEERFQLDEFARLLREAYHYLNSALEIDELNNWKALRQAQNYLKILPHKLTKAKSSLQKFQGFRMEFMHLEQIIKSYDLARARSRASALQKECAHYWYPYHQMPEFWRKALGDRPLPLKSILDLKNEFLA